MSDKLINGIKLVLETCLDRFKADYILYKKGKITQYPNGMIDSEDINCNNYPAHVKKAMDSIISVITDNMFGESVEYSTHFEASWKLFFYKGYCFAARILRGQGTCCQVWIFDHAAGQWDWVGDKEASVVFNSLQKTGKQYMLEPGETDENGRVIRDDFYIWSGRTRSEILALVKEEAAKDVPLFIETIAPYIQTSVFSEYLNSVK